MNISQETIDTFVEVIKKELNPIFIYIFGSAVEGHFTSESDLDIAFLSEEQIPPYQRFMVEQSIAGKVGRDVDLIDLKTSSMVFKAQVVGHGRVVFSKDDNRLADFNIKSLKEYAYLNDERKAILDRIKEKGGVYE